MIIKDPNHQLILHAPNIHTGGGLTLLQQLIHATNFKIKWAQLDKRSIVNLNLDSHSNTIIYQIKHSIFDRLAAEWRLWRHTDLHDVVLCFHGLPPLLPIRSAVVVLLQNRILFESENLGDYPLLTKIRLWIERIWVRMTYQANIRYIVQTPAMLTSVKKILGDQINISVFPFANTGHTSCPTDHHALGQKFDFVYIASGEAHKNHLNLLEAWRLLAASGYKPSLALTIDSQLYSSLSEKINRYIKHFSLDIINLGVLSINKVSEVYQASSALIFPSLSESFGLPLLEASQHQLPILAAERDYVRELVLPTETFDPQSPLSIARAVRRFMGQAEPIIKIYSPEDFLEEVIK